MEPVSLCLFSTFSWTLNDPFRCCDGLHPPIHGDASLVKRRRLRSLVAGRLGAERVYALDSEQLTLERPERPERLGDLGAKIHDITRVAFLLHGSVASDALEVFWIQSRSTCCMCPGIHLVVGEGSMVDSEQGKVKHYLIIGISRTSQQRFLASIYVKKIEEACLHERI